MASSARSRSSVLLLALAATTVLAGCTYSDEPAPDQPAHFTGLTTEGFPPPGPPPVPGRITPAPAPLPEPSNAPRRER